MSVRERKAGCEGEVLGGRQGWSRLEHGGRYRGRDGRPGGEGEAATAGPLSEGVGEVSSV